MHFTNEELNALGIIVSNATIKGQDAKFIANLLDKIAAMLKAEQVSEQADQMGAS